jgi:ADP-ribose pyrophosphatase YjhB (NUDIX family)
MTKSEYGHPATEKATFLIRCRAIIVCGDKILAVKHFEGAKYYALPGGHMEAGEDPIVCIKREIKEELNIEMANPILKYIYEWKGEGGEENVEFVFLVKDTINEADIDMKKSSHAFEIFESRWIGTNETIDEVVYPREVFKDFQENNFEFEGVKFVRE